MHKCRLTVWRELIVMNHRSTSCEQCCAASAPWFGDGFSCVATVQWLNSTKYCKSPLFSPRVDGEYPHIERAAGQRATSLLYYADPDAYLSRWPALH